jgi:hypothetical protein
MEALGQKFSFESVLNSGIPALGSDAVPPKYGADSDLRLYAKTFYYVPFRKNDTENQTHIGTQPLPHEDVESHRQGSQYCCMGG